MRRRKSIRASSRYSSFAELPGERTEEVPEAIGRRRDGDSPSLEPVPTWPIPEPERYVLSGEWAVGGLGRILEASDRRLDRRVAIKELLRGGADAEARFIREALITARLQHPSIVPIYDLGQDAEGKPFYAMKMISGRTLDELAAEKDSLQERYGLIPHLIAVADAIAYAHSQGIVHRDLKPSNVMIGDFGETLVIDWGVAADLRGRASAQAPSSSYDVAVAGLTVQGAVIGTPEYMPPEQARGETVDERADIYALGAILYFVLSRVPPFQGKSSKEIVSTILHAEPLSLQRRQPGIAPELAAIVSKAMARNPAQRYASARQMSEDLKRFQSGQLVSAHRYSIPLRFWRWAKRHRLPLASILALAIIGVLSANRIVRERNLARQQWGIAEEQRRLAENRGNELILAQASSSLERDPTAAIAWLKQYPATPDDWQKPKELAADAVSRGIARHVFDHGRDITDIAVSPDGKRLASAGRDEAIRIWDLATGKQLQAFPQKDVMNSVAFSPQGQWLAWAGKDKTVWLWPTDGGPPRQLGVHLAEVHRLAFSPAGNQLASIADDGSVGFWDLSARAGRTIQAHRGRVFALVYSKTGRQIATAGHDRLVRLWNAVDGTYRTLAGQRDEIFTIAFSPDESQLAAAGKEGRILVWDLESGKHQTLVGHPGGVTEVDFSPDGKSLASAGLDKSVKIWNLASGAASTFTAHADLVDVVRYSPDGRFLLSAGHDNVVRLWDLEAGSSRILRGHRRAVHRMVLLPGSRQLVTASPDGTARLWDLSLNASQPLHGHRESVIHAVFSPDGRYLASDSIDRTARLWDLAAGLPARLRARPGRAPRAAS